MKRFIDWLDDRTGIRHFIHESLYERIPGGARWRYVWGSTLVFAFVVQAITGLFLWMCYAPGAQSAWESVYYIQYQMQGGWLLRGLHHFMAQAMVVLLMLHLMQVVIDGAYRAPREINFWIGLVLMQITLGLSLTGYLLPWDQKGYWATRVATNLMGLVPFAGEHLQKLVVGGADYGHHTLTRFFALHAGLLPALLVGFLVIHVYVFRRHGITAHQPLKKPETTFWPDQVLRDAVACLAVLVVVLVLVLRPAIAAFNSGSSEPFDMAHAGAELGAPADPSKPYSAARPEWYFLFLFQLLKYFPGKAEIFGALVLPGLVGMVLVLMPILGRWQLGHRFNVAFMFILTAAIVALTAAAWHADHRGPDSADYLAAVAEAEIEAARAVELAEAPAGIAESGAAKLLRNDARTQGKLLFARNVCNSCHGYTAPLKPGEDTPTGAPALQGFASRAWIEGLLDPKRIASDEYFGRTKHKGGDMVQFVTGDLQDWKKEHPQEFEDLVIALSAEAQLPAQAAADHRDAARIARGIEHLASDELCAQCHKFHNSGELGSAPDLTGYGSRAWLVDFISNPSAERFYADDRNDRMPAFAAKPPGSTENRLTPLDLNLIVDYLRQDWYVAPHRAATHSTATRPGKSLDASRVTNPRSVTGG